MDTNNVIVSIIVPVYNGEAYINKCIDSLLKQTYHELEIIIVNDGSIDATLDICREYQSKYSNIELISKCNEGVTVARLEGLKRAKGIYISYVDADDWIDNDYISIMIEKLGDADIILAGINRILLSEGNKVVEEKNRFEPGLYEGEDKLYEIYEKMLCFEMPFKSGILPYACNKLYRKKILLPLMENVDKRINDGEDVAVIFPYLINSKKIVISDYCGYNYLIHSGSVCHSKKRDAYYNAACLYAWLYDCFKHCKYADLLLTQLRNYFLRMIWKRNPAIYLETNEFLFPFKKIEKDSNVILYGAGDVGQAYYRQIMQTSYCNVVAWADRNSDIDEKLDCKLISPQEISLYKFDYIIIAINSIYICKQVELFLENEGINSNKIIY